ncbi:MAG TPA: saccharopine dehydrogenase NADP-binding domain-containing protein [Solirubrobacterales bacterium]|nr:saccharopine dehydrogenase NADP-binding domain-containing protein [Solirubrobacterales bacterium]
MPETPQQTGPIAVYGATGYTGRLVAAELRRRGAEMVLAGRNRAKLEILAEDLGGQIAIRDASLDDPTALRELLEPCAAVIACAGPFLQHGEPILAAAIDARAHYLDTTGEQPFMRKVFEANGRKAARAGVALVTAMGFDYAPGDMIAALTAEGMEPLDEIVLAYAVQGFGVTRGTALSALGMMAGGDAEWREGELASAPRGVGGGSWDFPDPIGRQRMLRYPAGEHITVPRHVRTGRVRTLLTASTIVPLPLVPRVAPLAMAPFQLAARTPLRRALAAAIHRLPDGPSEESRRSSSFTIVCEARRNSSRRRGTVTGGDLYGFTARTTVEGALRFAAPGFDRKGALAPSEAFDARHFLGALREFGIEHEVE